MTVKAFSDRMTAICALRDGETVKREGLKLIVMELGAGVPGYLDALELFMRRLNRDGVGGTDGSTRGT